MTWGSPSSTIISGIYGSYGSLENGAWFKKKHTAPTFQHNLGANKKYTMVSYRNPCCGYIAARKKFRIPGISWVPSAHPHVLPSPAPPRSPLPAQRTQRRRSIGSCLKPHSNTRIPARLFLMISWDDCRLYMTLPDSWTIPMILDVSIRSPRSPNFPCSIQMEISNIVDGLFLPRSPLVLRLHHDVFSQPGYRLRYALRPNTTLQPNKSRGVTHLGVSENRLNPIVPNGFADHYPYEKWLAIIGNIHPTFSGPNPIKWPFIVDFPIKNGDLPLIVKPIVQHGAPGSENPQIHLLWDFGRANSARSAVEKPAECARPYSYGLDETMGRFSWNLEGIWVWTWKCWVNIPNEL